MAKKKSMEWDKDKKQWYKRTPAGHPEYPKLKWASMLKLRREYPSLFINKTKEGSRDAANQFWDDYIQQGNASNVLYDAELNRRSKIFVAEYKRLIDSFIPSSQNQEDIEQAIAGIQVSKKITSDNRKVIEDFISDIDEVMEQVATSDNKKTITDTMRLAMTRPEMTQIINQMRELADAKDSGMQYENTEIEFPELPTLPILFPAKESKDTAPTKRNLSYLIELFLSEEKLRTIKQKGRKKPDLTLARWKNKCTELRKALESIGDIKIEKVKEPELKEHYQFVRKMNLSISRKKNIFGVFKEFLNWCESNYHIDRTPRNIHDKKMRFTPPKKTPIPPTIEQTKEVLSILKDNNKSLLELTVLLHLNCGMLSTDVADISPDQIDLKKKTITYLRNKIDDGTDDKEAVDDDLLPVTYPLWKRTIQLLVELKSDDPELWLVNKAGKHYARGKDDARKDLIGSKFTDRKKDILSTYKKCLKDFRKTGSTELKNLGHKDCEDQFLQHSPESITDQFYSGQMRDPFIKAVKELEKVFFNSKIYKVK